ncbi:MAG: hypothetical protein U1E31_01345 [Rickettsiales bacterium]
MKKFLKLIVILLISFNIFYGIYYVINVFYFSKNTETNFNINYDTEYQIQEIDYQDDEITKEDITNMVENILQNELNNKINLAIQNSIEQEKQKKEEEFIKLINEVLNLSRYIYPKIIFHDENDNLNTEKINNLTEINKQDIISESKELHKNLKTIYLVLNLNCKISQQIFNSIKDILIKENLQDKYSVSLIYNPIFKNAEDIIKISLYINNNISYNKFINFNNFIISNYTNLSEIKSFFKKNDININLDLINENINNNTHIQINKLQKIFERIPFNSMPLIILNDEIYSDDLSYLKIKNIITNNYNKENINQKQDNN